MKPTFYNAQEVDNKIQQAVDAKVRHSQPSPKTILKFDEISKQLSDFNKNLAVLTQRCDDNFATLIAEAKKTNGGVKKNAEDIVNLQKEDVAIRSELKRSIWLAGIVCGGVGFLLAQFVNYIVR